MGYTALFPAKIEKVVKRYVRIHVNLYTHTESVNAYLHVLYFLQVNQVLELDKKSVCAARYNALDKWTSQLQSLHVAIVNKMS